MKTVIEIKGVIPGLNGNDGLIREHWTTAKKNKTKYQYLIRSQTKNRHKGAVRIQYIGYKSILMDWDNFAASFKHIGDSLVDSRVIVDDKPDIIVDFIPFQKKCSRKEQKIVVIIEDV